MDFFRERVVQVQLTRKEALVTDCILNSSNKVRFMSATELVATPDISDNTVNRLAKSIGYPSYLELQKQIRGYVSYRIENAQRFFLNPLERMFLADRSADTSDSSFEAQFLGRSFQSLQGCFRNNAPDKLGKVLSLFLNSQVGYIGDQRPTAVLVEKFGFILHVILSNVPILKDEYSFEEIVDIGPKDLFFLIDFNPYNRSTKRLLQYAQERKAQIVLLTDQFTSPLVHYATEVLVIDMNGFGFFNSNISAQALLKYLCAGLTERTSQVAEQRLNLPSPYFGSHELSSGKANEQNKQRRVPMKKSTVLILALLVETSLLTACSSSVAPSSSAASKRQGVEEIVYASATDISSMDPRDATNTQTASILNHMFSGLVTTDEKGQIVNGLTESYKNIDDKTWEFKLKDSVTFQDDSKLTSEDVKYTLDAIRDTFKRYRLASDFSFMQVKIVDELNLRIITEEPFSGFLLRLNYMKIIPKVYMKKTGDEEFAARPIGSDPYKFVSWSKGEKVALETNDTYFGDKPVIDEITYKVIPEAASHIAALESGEADIIVNIPTSQIGRLSSLEGVKVPSNPTTRMMFVGMNLIKNGPLQNGGVKQMLNYAVNKQALIEGVLDGNATQITTTSTPECEDYDASMETYSYGPGEAKQLLTEAGYTSGFSLQFSVTSRYLNEQDVAQAIASQLDEVGTTCIVQEEDSNQQREKMSNGTVTDLYLNGIGDPYSNINPVAKLAFGTGEYYSTYSNTEFNALRKEAAATVNEEKAKVKNSEIQKVIKERTPAIFPCQQHGVYAYNTRVSNQLPRVDEMILVSNTDVN